MIVILGKERNQQLEIGMLLTHGRTLLWLQFLNFYIDTFENPLLHYSFWHHKTNCEHKSQIFLVEAYRLYTLKLLNRSLKCESKSGDFHQIKATVSAFFS